MWLVVSLRSYAVRYLPRVRQQCIVKYPLLLSTLVLISLYKCVCVCVCFPMPTHCTSTHFGFRAKRIHGVECDVFSILAPLGQITLCVGQVSV